MVEPLRQWEYRVEDAIPVEVLNELGADGWELTGVDDRQHTRFIFRRPAQSFVERVTLEQRAHYYASLGLDPETGK